MKLCIKLAAFFLPFHFPAPERGAERTKAMKVLHLYHRRIAVQIETARSLQGHS